MDFKEGMIIVIKSNSKLKAYLQKALPDLKEDKIDIGISLLPNNLVTKVIKDNIFISNKNIKSSLTILDTESLIVPAEIMDALKFRKATKREEFLFHIEGKPVVVE